MATIVPNVLIVTADKKLEPDGTLVFRRHVPNLKANKAYYVFVEGRLYHYQRFSQTMEDLSSRSSGTTSAKVRFPVMTLTLGNSFIPKVIPEFVFHEKNHAFAYLPLTAFRMLQFQPGNLLELPEEEKVEFVSNEIAAEGGNNV